MNNFILNHNQKRILKNLSFLKKRGFYLAGGTALALYLGHRTSQDLDFYTDKHFNSLKLVDDFKRIFKKDLDNKPKIAEDTLWIKVKDTDLSFFYYPYSLIRPLVPYETIKLASIEDIIAMKIESIIGRGKKRDFVDMYFILKNSGLKKILSFFKEKYPQAFNEYICLTALTYFEEAEKKDQGRKRIYIYSGITWSAIKNYLVQQVETHQKSIIKELRK